MTIPVLPPPPNLQGEHNEHVWKDWYTKVYNTIKALSTGSGSVLEVQIFS